MNLIQSIIGLTFLFYGLAFSPTIFDLIPPIHTSLFDIIDLSLFGGLTTTGSILLFLNRN